MTVLIYKASLRGDYLIERLEISVNSKIKFRIILEESQKILFKLELLNWLKLKLFNE